MTTVMQVVEAAIPGADADTADFVLWGRTPYPMGRVSARSLFKAANSWRRAREHNLKLCDHCHNIAQHGDWVCAKCAAMLRASSEARR